MASLLKQQRKSLPHLLSDYNRYWLVLNTFHKDSNQPQLQAQQTEKDFDMHVMDTLSKKLDDKLHGGTLRPALRVLCVGSDDGYQDVLQLKKLKSKFPKIATTVIEPDKAGITKYQDTVQHCGSSGFSGIDFEWHNQTFQEYVKSKGTEKKYHFISLIHSAYYIGEAEEAVQNLFELLEPGGIVYMVLNSARTGMGKLYTTFPYLATLEYTSIRTSEDIKSILGKYQMAYYQSTQSVSIDITTCFTHPDSPKAAILLDLLTWTAHLKECADEVAFNEVLDFIKKNAHVTKNTDGKESFNFHAEVDTLFILK